jgi:biotin operon repressor
MKKKYKVEIEKLTDILPLFNEHGMTMKQVALATGRAESTIWKYVRLLREAGHEVKTQPKGNKKLII